MMFWGYKSIVIILLNIGLFFCINKIFHKLNRLVYCLTIIIGLGIGVAIDYILFRNIDNLLAVCPLLVIWGIATFLLANYIFKR